MLAKYRTVFRLFRTGLHLLWAVLMAACAFPCLPIKWRRALKARWSRQLLEVLGVRLQFAGKPQAGGLLVANHISWLDIYAINALSPSVFVAKDDVRSWPLIGWLSSQAGTVFLERGSRVAAMHAKAYLVDELRQGASVGLFPEGTTGNGNSVLPFHSALFQSAIDAKAPVLPVALRYVDSDGKISAVPVYAGETTLWQSLQAIAGAEHLTVHLDWLPALASAELNRRQLAEHCHQLIASCLARPAASFEEDRASLVSEIPASSCLMLSGDGSA